MQSHSTQIPDRPDFVVEDLRAPEGVDLDVELGLFRRIMEREAVRKALVIVILIAAWEIYTTIGSVNPLLFPSFTSTFAALIDVTLSGEIFVKAWFSFRILFFGYPLGIALAAILVILASASRLGRDFLSLITSIFQPLPAIALLPLATLWFGFGEPSLVFVTIHSIVWAVSLSTLAGFGAVGRTLVMVGENYGVSGLGLMRLVLVPAALPSILTGLRIGWAFAWRTLIGAELIFGAVSGAGGLGAMVFENSDWLRTDRVFATMVVIIMVGLVIENLIFVNIEKRTVRRWGTQS
ncbi:ABC transporter permease [Rhodophyticola sp. CCM32]|nr:ABC transporter permease [Rhodophyticola sp. CCM32]